MVDLTRMTLTQRHGDQGHVDHSMVTEDLQMQMYHSYLHVDWQIQIIKTVMMSLIRERKPVKKGKRNIMNIYVKRLVFQKLAAKA